ncbi:MAG: MFS transporter [SAR202 cluster bacterium]|nr:MFS transporter [SAR202 cluster bacterium]
MVVQSRLPVLETIGNSNYRRFWLAGIFGNMARWSWLLGSTFLVFQLSASAFLTQMTGVAFSASHLLLGLASGILVDRFDRRRILSVCYSVNSVVAVSVVLLLWIGDIHSWQVIFLTAIFGVFLTLDLVTRQAMPLDLVDREKLQSAMALETLSIFGGMMLGPLFAGLIIGSFPFDELTNVAFVYIAILAYYVASMLGIRNLVLPPKPVTSPKVASLVPSRSSLTVGLRAVAGTPAIVGVLGISILFNFTVPPHIPLIPVFAKDVFEVGPRAMGILGSAMGFGSVLGALVIASRHNLGRKSTLYFAGALTAMSMVLVFGLSRSYILSLCALVGVGLGASAFTIMQATIIVLSVDENVRGRVLGVLSMVIGVLPLGTLTVGGLAARFGPGPALVSVSAVGLVLAFVWITKARALRPI